MGDTAPEPWTLVGVVGDIRSRTLTDEPVPEIYVPQAQTGVRHLAVLLRTGASGLGALPAIRNEVHALDPDLPLRRVEKLETAVDRAVGTPRFFLTLFSLFA